ncbi:MAG: PilZ domain-containing protein [Acidobacteria bacterium]|nr:PilZ domain-containing protein [Acidobacteriota bacterium]
MTGPHRLRTMSIRQRQHIRFSLDIPASVVTRDGDRQETLLQQISIGGCFTGWEENIYTGDEFRLEIELPNGNFLPLKCRALYRFDHTGIGVRFIDISRFEQELVADLIRDRLEREGLPHDVDPFHVPPRFIDEHPDPRVIDIRQKTDSILQRIMSSDDDRI